MFGCQKFMFLLVMVMVFVKVSQSWAKPLTEPSAKSVDEAAKTELGKLMPITDDVIADAVEKDIKKVIRVNPLYLSSMEEDPNILNTNSSQVKVQTTKPFTGERKYTYMRRPKFQVKVDSSNTASGSPIIRILSLNALEKPIKPKHQPKKKHLHFLWNQEDLKGNLLSKTMHVNVAPGAYPVYYMVSKTNGRFGKYPIKNFNSYQAFAKYLRKNKLEGLPLMEKYEDM